MSTFKAKPLTIRKAESKNIKEKYPEKIPIIVLPATTKNLPKLDKNKFLVSKDLTTGQFLYIIRKRMKLDSNKALFLFTDKGTIPVTHEPLSIVYNSHEDEDGFLYFQYSSENTFG